MLVRGVVSDFITLNTALVVYFSRKINISPAVIQSFTTLSSFTTALLFYILYKEKLRIQHLVGMTLILSSVVTVAVSKSLERNDSLTLEGSFTFLQLAIPMCIAFSTALFLTFASFLARTGKSAGYPTLQFCVDFLCVAGFFYMLAFLYNHLLVAAYPWECIAFMSIAGFVMIGALVFLNLAIITGKGALAMAISQTQCFFWLLLEVTVSLRVPHFFEVFAMAIGISGACIITFAKK